MPNLSQLCLFTTASLIILLIPGPAVIYVAVHSVKGRTAGIVAVLGLEFGTVFHVVAAAFSISALSSLMMFNILKCFGAVYLIYLGIRKLLPPEKIQPQKMDQHENLQQIFWRGVMVEVLNPKTMFFFFAFLPQFVNYARGDVALQMLTLGFLFIGLATCIDTLYAILAGSVRYLLKNSRWFIRRQRYVESSVYVGLGIITALSDSKS